MFHGNVALNGHLTKSVETVEDGFSKWQNRSLRSKLPRMEIVS